MGNSFVLFDVSIVISQGQFHCGNRGHTQNTDFPWVKSHFPVGKRSSGTATIIYIRLFNSDLFLFLVVSKKAATQRGSDAIIPSILPPG